MPRDSACSRSFSQSVELAAQIDNGIDAQALELLYSIIPGLITTIEEIVDLAEICTARHINLIRECRGGVSARRLPVARATPDRDSHREYNRGDRGNTIGRHLAG